MKECMLALAGQSSTRSFTVAFHHTVDSSLLRRDYPEATAMARAQEKLRHWLDRSGLRHEDVSGSAERMIEFYDQMDLHVGYRVHAHIYMTSQLRPSVLIAEDGRGAALRGVLGGSVFDAWTTYRQDLAARVARRLSLPFVDPCRADPRLARDVLAHVGYEESNGFVRTRASFAVINEHLHVMQRFLAQLP
jgi:hypothetical protein